MHSAFENRVLRKIFGPKWEKVTEGWRKFHNEKLQDKQSSNRDIIKLV